MALDASAVHEYLVDLKGQGFDVSVTDFVRAERLLVALSSRGEAPGSLAEFSVSLGFLVCRAAGEQARYQAYVAERFSDEPVVLRVQQQSIPSAPAIPPPDPETDPAALQLHRAGKYRQWLRYLVSAAVLAIIGAVFFEGSGTVVEPIEPDIPEPEPVPGGGALDWGLLLESLQGVDRVLLALIPCLAFVVLVWIRGRQQRMLERRFAPASSHAALIELIGDSGRLFRDTAMHLTIAPLRKHREVLTRTVHAGRTILATIRACGYPQLHYRTRPISPDYLVLSRAGGVNELAGELVDSLVLRLREEAVHVVQYRFTRAGDALQSVDARPDGSTHNVGLPELVSRYGDYRLLLVDEGRFLFDPMNHDLHPWVDALQLWPERAIVTPLPEANFGFRERLLAEQGFTLVSLASDPELVKLGLAFSGDGASGVSQAAPRRPRDESKAAAYPESLERREARWVQPMEPPRRDIDKLFDELDVYLDEAAMRWLQAIAVFPKIMPAITRFLGAHLQDNGGEPLLTLPRYLALSRLPWLRRGHMPDWMRQQLIDRMGNDWEESVRLAILQLMSGREPVADPGLARAESQIIPLEVIRRDRRAWIDLLMQRARKAPADSMLREQLFIDFLAPLAPSGLAVAVPSRLLARLRRGLDPDLLVFGALALLASAFLYWVQPGLDARVVQAWLSPLNAVLLDPAATAVLQLTIFIVSVLQLSLWVQDLYRGHQTRTGERRRWSWIVNDVHRRWSWILNAVLAGSSLVALLVSLLTLGLVGLGEVSQAAQVKGETLPGTYPAGLPGPSYWLALGAIGLATACLSAFVVPWPARGGWRPTLLNVLLGMRRPWLPALAFPGLAILSAALLAETASVSWGNWLDGPPIAFSSLHDGDPEMSTGAVSALAWFPLLLGLALATLRDGIGGWRIVSSCVVAAFFGMLCFDVGLAFVESRSLDTIENQSIRHVLQYSRHLLWLPGLGAALLVLVRQGCISLDAHTRLYAWVGGIAILVTMAFYLLVGGEIGFFLTMAMLPSIALVTLCVSALASLRREHPSLGWIRILSIAGAGASLGLVIGMPIAIIFNENFGYRSAGWTFSLIQILPVTFTWIGVRYFALNKLTGPGIEPARSDWSWVASPIPWLLLPLLLLVNLRFQAGPFDFAVENLVYPVAIWLGAYYRKTGMAALAISMLPQLFAFDFDTISWGSDTGGFVLALGLCRFAGDSRWRRYLLNDFEPSTRQLLLLTLAVPLFFSLSLSDSLLLGWQGLTLLFGVFFLLGLGTKTSPRIAIWAIAVGSVGVILYPIGLTRISLGPFRFGYEYVLVEHIVNALLAFYLGRLTQLLKEIPNYITENDPRAEFHRLGILKNTRFLAFGICALLVLDVVNLRVEWVTDAISLAGDGSFALRINTWSIVSVIGAGVAGLVFGNAAWKLVAAAGLVTVVAAWMDLPRELGSFLGARIELSTPDLSQSILDTLVWFVVAYAGARCAPALSAAYSQGPRVAGSDARGVKGAKKARPKIKSQEQAKPVDHEETAGKRLRYGRIGLFCMFVFVADLLLQGLGSLLRADLAINMDSLLFASLVVTISFAAAFTCVLLVKKDAAPGGDRSVSRRFWIDYVALGLVALTSWFVTVFYFRFAYGLIVFGDALDRSLVVSVDNLAWSYPYALTSLAIALGLSWLFGRGMNETTSSFRIRVLDTITMAILLALASLLAYSWMNGLGFFLPFMTKDPQFVEPENTSLSAIALFTLRYGLIGALIGYLVPNWYRSGSLYCPAVIDFGDGEKRPVSAGEKILGPGWQNFYQPKIFSINGRIGRLRYLVYYWGVTSLLMAALLPLFGLAISSGGDFVDTTAGILSLIVFYLVTILIMVIYAKRRLNDLGRSGWWSLLYFVPIANILIIPYLFFFPGSTETNRYGEPPAPNSRGVLVMSWILGLLLVLILILAVAP